jgi:hypothetical protein
MGRKRGIVARARSRLAGLPRAQRVVAAEADVVRLRKHNRALQASLGKARAALEEAEARADMAEDEVLATPYRRWVPIEDGGQGHWLPKGQRPEEAGTFFVRLVDVSDYVYTGTAYPNHVSPATGDPEAWDDECYDVQVYFEWKDKDVRWWSAPTPPPPPLEGQDD